jgi:hypothetical protein
VCARVCRGGVQFHDRRRRACRVLENASGAIGSLRDEVTGAINGTWSLSGIAEICQHAFGRDVSPTLDEWLLHYRVYVESRLTGDARVARRAALDRA